MNNFNILSGVINKKFEWDSGNTLGNGLQHFWKMNDHIDFVGENNLNYYIKGVNAAGNAALWRNQTASNFHNINGKRDFGIYTSGKTQGGAWTEKQIIMGSAGSLSFWSYINVPGTNFDGEPDAYNTDYPGQKWALNIIGGGGGTEIYLKVSRDSSWLLSVSKPAANTWFHCVCSWSGTNRKIYINGNLDKNGTGSVSTAISGKLYFNSHFQNRDQITKGYLCDIGIWNRQLTAAECQFLYNSGNGNTMIYG